MRDCVSTSLSVHSIFFFFSSSFGYLPCQAKPSELECAQGFFVVQSWIQKNKTINLQISSPYRLLCWLLRMRHAYQIDCTCFVGFSFLHVKEHFQIGFACFDLSCHIVGLACFSDGLLLKQSFGALLVLRYILLSSW